MQAKGGADAVIALTLADLGLPDEARILGDTGACRLLPIAVGDLIAEAGPHPGLLHCPGDLAQATGDAALAGMVLVGYLGYADQNIGIGYEWDSIAAVALGGAVLGGGQGRVSGTIAGVLLMTVMLNLVLVLKLKVEYQYIIRGVVILAAVAFYAAEWKWKGKLAS